MRDTRARMRCWAMSTSQGFKAHALAEVRIRRPLRTFRVLFQMPRTALTHGFDGLTKTSGSQMCPARMQDFGQCALAETGFNRVPQADADGLRARVHDQNDAKVIALVQRVRVERTLVQKPETHFGWTQIIRNSS